MGKRRTLQIIRIIHIVRIQTKIIENIITTIAEIIVVRTTTTLGVVVITIIEVALTIITTVELALITTTTTAAAVLDGNTETQIIILGKVIVGIKAYLPTKITMKIHHVLDENILETNRHR